MSSEDQAKGFVLCVVGPSGSGKTSLCDRLAAELPYARRSISITTRPLRNGETSGDDYHFVSVEEFERMKAEDLFLETAEVFGNWYGTPRQPVEAALEAGLVMVMDIDTVGAQAVKSRLGARCVRVFIMPPSMEVLATRLKQRKQNDPQDLERRLKEASREIAEGRTYEYVIENQEFDRAYEDFKRVVESQRQLFAEGGS